jgi:omega-6 fatty acid desaturase (delta-12 desaturase)
MSSLDDVTEKGYGKLIDTYGNEFELPDYTVNDIRNAIPKHCFERSGLRGLSYVARDITSLAVTFFLFNKFVTPENIPYTPVRALLWFVYTVVQGLFGTGLWVLAHECGHQSFSPSKVLNDTTGWICHSALLVPYFSWKISHGKHHKATGNMERDMVFVPKTREVFATRIGKFIHELDELTEETPIATLLHSVGQQLLGWPMYLLGNVTGHNNHERQPEGRGKGKVNGYFTGVNHFSPFSPLYEAKDAKLILLSDLGLTITITVLVLLCQKFGFSNMAVWYFAPYLWVNHWLGTYLFSKFWISVQTANVPPPVAITYLQHTDPTLPHYTGESWNYVRGAAATIDREFGFIGRTLLHGIIETHVLHHYVSTIPFYNADEASEAIKPIMGRHYRADVKDGWIGFLKAMWTSARWCQWVEPSKGAIGEGKGVLFYRNRNGLGTAPLKLKEIKPVVGNAKMGMVVGADEDSE